MDAFWMDAHPVTNSDFLKFVRKHREWQRSRVKRLFAESSYLAHWSTELDYGDSAQADRPVINVSWFAAKAYCKARGATLPTVDQWEYVAAASAEKPDASRDPQFQSFLRTWYSRPTPSELPSVGSLENYYGVSDLHGVVWEWTLDFSSALVTGESRADASLERSLFCGSGAAGASDFENYAAFMRYAFRSSLEARYSVPNLGFRCVCVTGG
jgi:formylglycine-generating enzyme required for sulfatase activity